MLFFFHLLTGIILGILIADLLSDRRRVIPFVIGAVLPDLIDKPMGYIFFTDAFGNGRIFMHSLLLFCAFLIIGLVIWMRSVKSVVLALALGIISHQVLDMMWEEPTTWYFPLLGQFKNFRGDYTFALLQSDISARSEWILAAVIVIAFIVYFASKHNGNIISGYRNIWAGFLGAWALGFLVLAGVAIGTGLLPIKGILLSSLRFFGWTEPVEFIIGGIVFALCAYLLWHQRSCLIVDNEIQSEKE